MEKRRLEMVAMPEEEYRMAMLKELDHIEKRVGDKCELRVASVLQAVSDGQARHDLAMKENTLISTAALNAINGLIEKLSFTIAAEEIGKTTVDVAKKGVIKGSTIAKILIPLITLWGIIVAISHKIWPTL